MVATCTPQGYDSTKPTLRRRLKFQTSERAALHAKLPRDATSTRTSQQVARFRTRVSTPTFGCFGVLMDGVSFYASPLGASRLRPMLNVVCSFIWKNKKVQRRRHMLLEGWTEPTVAIRQGSLLDRGASPAVLDVWQQEDLPKVVQLGWQCLQDGANPTPGSPATATWTPPAATAASITLSASTPASPTGRKVVDGHITRARGSSCKAVGCDGPSRKIAHAARKQYNETVRWRSRWQRQAWDPQS